MERIYWVIKIEIFISKHGPADGVLHVGRGSVLGDLHHLLVTTVLAVSFPLTIAYITLMLAISRLVLLLWS